MRVYIGLIMIIGGIVLGIYVGAWLCFIGGIVQIINEVKSPEAARGLVILWGIFRILLTIPAGLFSAFVLIIPGYKIAS